MNEALDRVYIVDARELEIDVFTRRAPTSLPSRARATRPGSSPVAAARSTSTPTGNVWVGDFGGFETEKFTPTAHRCSRRPTPPASRRSGCSASPATSPSTTRPARCGSPTHGTSGSCGSARPASHWAPGAARPRRPVRHELPAVDRDRPRYAGASGWRRSAGHHIQVYNYPTSATAVPDLRPPDRSDRRRQHRARQLPLAGRHRVLHAARRAPRRHDRRPHGASVKMFDANTYVEITKPVDPDPTRSREPDDPGVEPRDRRRPGDREHLRRQAQHRRSRCTTRTVTPPTSSSTRREPDEPVRQQRQRATGRCGASSTP